MIIQRLSQGIKNQDWFVVMVEVMIVVVGIFIGLQVDDWNQERKDRQEADRFLGRIYQDQFFNLNKISEDKDRLNTQATSLKIILDYIQGRVSDVPPVLNQKIGLCSWFISQALQLERSVFDELVSSGKLSLIKDGSLRNVLQTTHSLHDRIDDDFDLFGDTIKLKAGSLNPFLEWYEILSEEEIIHGQNINASCHVDIEGIKNSKDINP